MTAYLSPAPSISILHMSAPPEPPRELSSSWSSRIVRSLRTIHRPVDARLLALFRMLFGAVMFYETRYYIQVGVPGVGLTAPKVLFKYDGLEWLHPLTEAGMTNLLDVMGLLALAIMVGLFHRVATALFTLGFAFIFFQDKALYNNHLYLFFLLGGMLSCMAASRVWSVDRALPWNKGLPTSVPLWMPLLLRVQLFIVYFYGGIAKLNGDWLIHHQPMRAALENWTRGTDWHGFMTAAPTVMFFTYGGLLFDLVIGFLLWFPRTRLLGVLGMLFFNVTNHLMFDDIGVFPFVMIGATMLFIDPDAFGRWWDRNLGGRKVPSGKRKGGNALIEIGGKHRVVNTLLVVYLTFQLLFPLRWVVLPWDVDWTSIGQRFSWRMKVQTRDLRGMAWTVRDRSGNSTPVDVTSFVNTMQVQQMAHDPRCAVRFARWLKQDLVNRGYGIASVHAEIILSYNGRPFRYLFDPDQDLSGLKPDIWHPERWIPPMDAPGLLVTPPERGG